VTDIWSEWLLKRRFGGDAALTRETFERVSAIRDRVLQHARLTPSDVLLDVGCGDGLIGFGALHADQERSVIFADISHDLLVLTRSLVSEMGVGHRARIVQGCAERLPLADGSVDAVAMRAVLIYISEKEQALREFHRVLRPGGRLSIFEPINRFRWPEPDHIFFGYDVTPVAATVNKVKELYSSLQPLDSDPMMNFDERDLLDLAQKAGFIDLHLRFDVDITKSPKMRWQTLLDFAGNPKIPTLSEAMHAVLTPEECDAVANVLGPLVEAGAGVSESAGAYVWAMKR
jgi:ubiquinone/menaquinone biosynthesis C-methylase UbiE